MENEIKYIQLFLYSQISNSQFAKLDKLNGK